MAEIAQAIARIVEEQTRQASQDDAEVIDTQVGGGTEGTGPKALVVADFSFPAEIVSRNQLEDLIRRLEALRAELDRYSKIVFKP